LKWVCVGKCAGFPTGISGSPSPVARPTGLVQTGCLRDEIVDYAHSVFEPVADEAVHGLFGAVIEQLQPKQRCAIAIKIGPRAPKHADLAAADRGEQNRRFWTVPRNGRESAVGSRNFQFSQRPFERELQSVKDDNVTLIAQRLTMKIYRSRAGDGMAGFNRPLRYLNHGIV